MYQVLVPAHSNGAEEDGNQEEASFVLGWWFGSPRGAVLLDIVHLILPLHIKVDLCAYVCVCIYACLCVFANV